MSTELVPFPQKLPNKTISDAIFARINEPLRFDQRDVAEYKWAGTYTIYGRGCEPLRAVFEHYVGPAPEITILDPDDYGRWSVRIFRHKERLYEFFLAGLEFVPPGEMSVSDDCMVGDRFYPLTEEEKACVRAIVDNEFTETLALEIECLAEYLLTNAESSPDRDNLDTARPKPLKLLFGYELYQGEDQEAFRARMLRHEFHPTAELYVWKDGIKLQR